MIKQANGNMGRDPVMPCVWSSDPYDMGAQLAFTSSGSGKWGRRARTQKLEPAIRFRFANLL